MINLDPISPITVATVAGHVRLISRDVDQKMVVITMTENQLFDLYRSAGWELQVRDHEKTTA